MDKKIKWSRYFKIDTEKQSSMLKEFGLEKIFGMGLMPVRGSRGFRKLDYEFAEKMLNVKEVMDTLEAHHINVLGLVIKDTDGACLWNTQIGWNPTNRDVLGEFCDEGRDREIRIIVSFTSMNDAYQGWLHPERVSVHGKQGTINGVKYHKGELSTHQEGEMRINLPSHVSIDEYKKKVPFLTNITDEKVGKARSTRGKGFIPLTSFMCPNSEHIDYLLDLTREVVKIYPIKAFFADYIRFDGAFRDICACHRCVAKFEEIYGPKAILITSSEWYDFKSDTITTYAKRLHDTIKKANHNCLSGWFCLPGPKKLLSRKRLGQDWSKLSAILDVTSPMEYPYLMGTKDDGLFWGLVGNFFYWYFIRNMKKRAREFNNAVLAVTNSVECNEHEMMRQVKGFDFGLGIAVFKYFGTKEAQWKALKQYAETELVL
jgi:hypothetical protein